MKICYFGDYDPEYNRTRVILKGLRTNGVEVIECRDTTPGWKKYYNLYKKHRSIRDSYDVMIVGFSNARLLPVFAKCITRKKVAWDALFSRYDNWIFDRKLASPKSVKAYYYWLVDWIGCIAADVIFLDTNANIDYFVQMFSVQRKKFARILVGTDTDYRFPRGRVLNGRFVVEYHGKYIPVQGVEYIVQAAKILEEHRDIVFVLIGSGQESEKIKALTRDLNVKNITFVHSMPFPDLVQYIWDADVCMGLVGDVPRVEQAIPNKLYEAAACERVSINADTKALREVFTPGEDVVVVRKGSSEDIAEKILFLKNNPEEKDKMAKNAYATFQKYGTPESIGREVLEIFR